MLKDYNIYQLLFIDVETVSTHPELNATSDYERQLWTEKARFWLKDYMEEVDPAASCYRDRAAILAEFGRVVCISIGYIVRGEETSQDALRLKSFAGSDEVAILTEFNELMKKHFNDANKYAICGHNLKEFDIPYLCRRMIMNGIKPTHMLDISGKKPWEVRHLIDTLELWKFGDIKHYTSLKLLAHCLGIPSPKNDIDGSQVGRVFYQDGDIDAIARYCEGDVVAVAQIIRRFCFQPLLDPEAIGKG